VEKIHHRRVRVSSHAWGLDAWQNTHTLPLAEHPQPYTYTNVYA